MKEMNCGWADVRRLIEYKKETVAGDFLTVRTSLKRLGTTSIEYVHEIRNTETHDLHSTSTQVTVFFDLARRHATPITEEIKARAVSLGLTGTPSEAHDV
jgi:acyl-CoA thioester hydrolase